MTQRREHASAEMRRLPDDRQAEAAELLLAFVAQEKGEIGLTAEHRAEVRKRLSAAPDYAGDGEIAALFERLTR